MASFADQKAALFSREAKPASANALAPVPAPGTRTQTPARVTISAEAKQRKINEAKELTDQGMKFMRKGWVTRPDPVAAVGFFDKAAQAYEAAGEPEKAKLMYVQAAQTHEETGASSAAAIDYKKAAKLASSSGQASEAAELYRKCGDSWALYGETDKRGEYYLSAATELAAVDIDQATATLRLAVDALVPHTGHARELRGLSGNTPDHLRKALSFFIQHTMYEDAQSVAEKQIAVCSAMELESSLFKTMATVIALQLARGDAVAADITFNEHLGNAKYRSSRECAVAEELVMSFKTYDTERLLRCQNSRDIVYLERDTIALIKQLSLGGTTREDQVFDQASRDLAEVLHSGPTGIPDDASTTLGPAADDDLDAELAAVLIGPDDANPESVTEPEEQAEEDERDEIDFT